MSIATSLAFGIAEYHKTSKFFFDSKFKTNREIFEMFAFILSVMATGFLLGYLIMRRGSCVDD